MLPNEANVVVGSTMSVRSEEIRVPFLIRRDAEKFVRRDVVRFGGDSLRRMWLRDFFAEKGLFRKERKAHPFVEEEKE